MTAEPARLLLIRHAEVHNPEQVLYGRLPGFRLSEAGQRHAEQIAQDLAGERIAAIYSSPLLRARQTAEAIAAHHPEASRHRSALLLEVGSAWHGRRFDSFPKGFNTFDNHLHADDETMDDIRERMLRFVRRCGRRHAGQTVAAVSHGDPITILRVALTGEALTLAAIRGDIYAPLGSVTEIVVNAEGAMALGGEGKFG